MNWLKRYLSILLLFLKGQPKAITAGHPIELEQIEQIEQIEEIEEITENVENQQNTQNETIKNLFTLIIIALLLMIQIYAYFYSTKKQKKLGKVYKQITLTHKLSKEQYELQMKYTTVKELKKLQESPEFKKHMIHKRKIQIKNQKNQMINCNGGVNNISNQTTQVASSSD